MAAGGACANRGELKGSPPGGGGGARGPLGEEGDMAGLESLDASLARGGGAVRTIQYLLCVQLISTLTHHLLCRPWGWRWMWGHIATLACGAS